LGLDAAAKDVRQKIINEMMLVVMAGGKEATPAIRQ
jgi:hypothetical protein